MARIRLIALSVFITAMVVPTTAQAVNKHYPANREGLAQSEFVELPLGAVKPKGWLLEQLTLQANGLTGHLDEFWDSLLKSAWRGDEQGEGWERGPYYLDGLVPLAYLLDDQRLKTKVKTWMDWMLKSGQPSGWFGPPKNKDRWPLAVALKVLTQYYEATEDPQAMRLIENYFRFLRDNPPDWPDKEWRGVRAMENAVTGFWLYRRTGDSHLLKVIQSIQDNSFNWTEYFTNFPFTDEVLAKGYKPSHASHVVNIAMAIKHPGVWYQASKDEKHKKAVYKGLENLDKYHGQVNGRFSGDEHLAGHRPTQGTELCAVVEFMFSLEQLITIFGDIALADRLEMLAYNALPGTCTADYWAHQYDQQANQVLVSKAKRQWRTNGDDSNLYGLEPNYGCCTSNMHQGWPKLVAHSWMATQDQGLAAIVYGPNQVTAKVGETGELVTISQETDYPFDGTILLLVEPKRPVEFPLYLRIPAWAEGAQYAVGEEPVTATAGQFTIIKRTWKPGDSILLMLPLTPRTETRYNNAVSIIRGPLNFSLKIGEKRTSLKTYHDKFPVADWQIEPTTPWNYGLMLNMADLGDSVTVITNPVGKVPFDTADAPVVLKVKGKQISEWQMAENSAADPPQSPVASTQPATDLELIPYGSTRLRITEFPIIKDKE